MPEERGGELLWRHVVDLRNQEPVADPESQMSAARTAADELELRETVRLAGELPAVLASVRPRGEADARGRLMAVIARDVSARARRRGLRQSTQPGRPRSQGSRLTLALAAGLLLLAIAAWVLVLYANRDTCAIDVTPSAPSPGPMRRAPSPPRRLRGPHIGAAGWSDAAHEIAVCVRTSVCGRAS